VVTSEPVASSARADHAEPAQETSSTAGVNLPFSISRVPEQPSRALRAVIQARVPNLLTRFAPAPTGNLHLGHVVNAIYVWGLARSLRGRVLLRIEDHDRQRSRRDAEQKMLDDLDWLGLEADIYPTPCYKAAACDGRQSERDEVYRRALAPLIESGMIYGCRCSRASHATGRYAGTCRDAGIPLGDDVGWRLRIEAGIEEFDDVMLGPQSQDPSVQSGDLLIRDRLGNWTYQCVATIDDADQGITLVVRGEDLLSSTGRQIRLARLVGRSEAAVFLHHPLILKSPTQKLSKSDGDSGLADLRARGWTPEQVLGQAAALAGLRTSAGPLAASELAALFTPK
jgi:glutamyl/glutaminyl-tRNA synthetase